MKHQTQLGFPVKLEGPHGNVITCQVAGPAEAPQIVLTSGIGCGPVFYRDIAPLLAQKYRIIFWDFRAHGTSDLAPDGRSYRIEDHASDLDVVVNELTDRTPYMLGFSMGVQVTLEWIKRFEGRKGSTIPGFVFLLGAPRNPLRNHWFWGSETMRRSLDQALDLGMDGVVRRLHPISKAILRNRLSYFLAHRLGIVNREFAYKDYSEFIHYSSGVRPDAYLRTATGALDHDALDVWRELDVPTLYLAAENDCIVPASECRNVVHLRSSIRYGELKGGSHAATVEVGESLAMAVRKFIDACEALQSKNNDETGDERISVKCPDFSFLHELAPQAC